MTLRHGFFVPQDALEAVGHSHDLSPETRLYARLQNVYGVVHVEVGPLVMLPGEEGVHRMYAVTRHIWDDSMADELFKLFVQDAIVEFCRKMARTA